MAYPTSLPFAGQTLVADSASVCLASDHPTVVVSPWALGASTWQFASAASGIVNSTTPVTIKAAAAGTLRNYITGFDIMAETLMIATEFVIRDGAGQVLWRTKIPVSGIPTGRNITCPVPLRGSPASLLEIVTLMASVIGAVYFNAQGYEAQ